MKTLILFCSLAIAVHAGERVIIGSPVRTVTSADDDIFPESWRKAPILASGGELPESQHERVKKILLPALKKYPEAVLKKYLHGIYVLSELKYSGVTTSGTNSRTGVYLKIGEPKQGFTDAWIEGVFHAEFSSILWRERNRKFPTAAWQKLNPPGFEYLGNGVDAVKQNKAGTNRSAELNERGFQTEYAQSTLENDFNGFAELIFSGNTALWKHGDRYPKLVAKRKLAIEFYGTLDETFTEDYFRSLQTSK
jgi:hypothetical protein